ncbi:hypothetical protein SISSUDRAFT_1122545 [Sistotremastrum suecicum HHB10207 ss-3]|uniref:Uncharacterized protein n=1 Tax=Sistotremastrum suecicum HHB10207 ss-3 TaxID=1314776 RepID=A0A165Z687_9AGAM|nr:hypothetical protein SISSUDRAFT_1122545 [Sistotremastrum suecicum HHB10207 ss-3]
MANYTTLMNTPAGTTTADQPLILCCVGQYEQKEKLIGALLDIPSHSGNTLRAWCSVEYHISPLPNPGCAFEGWIEKEVTVRQGQSTDYPAPREKLVTFHSRDWLAIALENAQKRALPYSLKNEAHVGDVRLHVYMRSANAAHATIIDTPPSAASWEESRLLAHLRQGMILWALRTDDCKDIISANQPWVSICGQADPQWSRTISVAIPVHSTGHGKNFSKLTQSAPAIPVGLGPYAIISSTHPKRQLGDAWELDYFAQTTPWSTVPNRSLFGITNLIGQLVHMNQATPVHHPVNIIEVDSEPRTIPNEKMPRPSGSSPDEARVPLARVENQRKRKALDPIDDAKKFFRPASVGVQNSRAAREPKVLGKARIIEKVLKNL